MDALIKKIKNYITLTDDDLSVIENLFVRKTVKKHERFLSEGSICKYVCFIEKGLFKQYINKDGRELILHFPSESDILTDYPSFINKQASFENIEALEDSVLYCILFDHLQEFYNKRNCRS